MELNLASSSIPQRWEFKLAYSIAYMEEPKHTAIPGTAEIEYYVGVRSNLDIFQNPSNF